MFRILLIVVLVATFTTSHAQKRLYPIRSNGAWGLIDVQGNLVVNPNYSSIGKFSSDGYSIVQQGKLLGVLDTTGKEVIPCQYPMLNYAGQGLFSVKETDNWKVIDLTGRVVFDTMPGNLSFMADGYVVFEELTGKGLAHRTRGIILPPQYAKFELVGQNGFIKAIDGDRNQFLFDSTGQAVLSGKCEDIAVIPNWIWAKESGKWGAYTWEGIRILATNWISYQAVGSNFYLLSDEEDRRHLYCISRDSIVFARKHYWFFEFDDDYVQFVDVRNRQDIPNANTGALALAKKGLININGEIILEADYEEIYKFGDKTFRAKKGDNYGVVDEQGKELIPFAYDYISGLRRTVAVLKKDKKHGIVNFNGKITLSVSYDAPFNLEENVLRHKDSTGTLQIFTFNDDGELKRNNRYANLKSLKIRTKIGGRGPARPRTQIVASNPNQISDSLVWQFHQGSRKWGLWNLNTQEYKYYPQWDEISIERNLGWTIVCKTRMEIGGRINTGSRVGLKVNRVYGLFANSHGVPITKMEFIDIRLSDFDSVGLDVARCIFAGGSHGLIARTGRVLTRGFVYIGEFVEGKVRATRKGRLVVDMKNKVRCSLIGANDYFTSFMSGFSFDNNSTEVVYDAFVDYGSMYCVDAKWGYLDSFGTKVLDFKYDYVQDYSNGRALIQHGGKWGMLDEDGNEVLEPQYDNFDFMPDSDKQLYSVSNNRVLHGAVDSNANIIVPVHYSKIRDFQEDRIAVRNEYNRWGFVDRNAKEIIPAKYRVANDFSEGLAVVYEKSRWGAIDKEGNVVIKPTYIRMGDFKEGKAWVYLKKGKKGYINPQGTLLFSGKYTRLTNFKDGIARVYIRKKGWGLIDDQGHFILKPKRRFKKIESFNEYGLAKVKIGRKYRLINREGKFVGKQAFGLIRAFKEGHAVVRVQALGGFSIGKPNLKYGFIDTTGELVTKEDFRQLQDFHEGRAAFTGERSKKGYLNYQGAVVVEPQYFRVEKFENNRAVVWKSYNKTGVIDTTGKEIIPVQYNKLIDINEGLAIVRKNGSTYYFVDENTDRHSPQNYEQARPFVRSMAPIKMDGKWGAMNRQGLQTMIPKYAHMEAYKDDIAKVSVYNLVGVVDIQGNVIIEPQYEYVSYAGDGLFRVEQGDKLGYLDMDGNWVWKMR